SVSGYIDVGYTHADRNIELFAPTSAARPRVFDNQNNSFELHQLGVTISKQPRAGFGGLVNFTTGKDAPVINSLNPNDPPASQFDLTQAYAQYARGKLTLIAGKFVTLHSTEVIASTGNTNISRSILFGSVPFTHTGVRGSWALNDQVSFYAGLNNGWDQLTDQNRPKTVELGASLNPVKPLTVMLSAYSGKESFLPNGTGPVNQGTRTSINAVASYTISDPLSVGVEYLQVSQEVPGAATNKPKYNGVALYGTYMFTPRYRGVLRYESFDDKDGLRFGPTGQKYKEVTVTGSYLAADNFEMRAEVRRDSATNPVFPEFAGPLSKSLMTLALQGLYKF
ncbi:MAG: porin, partial [Betaproteobacteria bacterium]